MALLVAAEIAVAQNQFWQTPSYFSFDRETQFFWTDGEGSSLKGLYVKGNTDPGESITLPRKFFLFKKHQKNMILIRNGTSSFGIQLHHYRKQCLYYLVE